MEYTKWNKDLLKNKLKEMHPNLYFLKTYTDNKSKSIVIVKDKYGELKCLKYNLLKGKTPTIKSAINKNKYFTNQAREVHGDKYDYSLVEYVNAKTKVKIICPRHGIFMQSPDNHLHFHGCNKCELEKASIRYSYSLEDFLKKANEVHNDKYDYSKTKYIDSKTKVCIICPIHGEFWQEASDHLQGRGCKKCAYDKNRLRCSSNTYDFIKKSNKIHGKKYDYSLVRYINNYTKIKIICPKHGVFEQAPMNHLGGFGCNKCAREIIEAGRRLTKKDFVLKSKKIHGNRYNYSKVNYINQNTEVCIVCPIHGEFWQKPVNHLNSRGCNKCNLPKGEARIEVILDKNNIKFILQKTFDKCVNKQKLQFDFYLPDYNLCIEYDGKQHFESIKFFGGEEKLKYTQQNDQIKNDYCKQNNINLLRIPYWDFDRIEKILEEKLKEIEDGRA